MDINLGKFWEMVRNREAWHAAVNAVTKNRTRLSDWTELNAFFSQTHSWSINRTHRQDDSSVKMQWMLGEILGSVRSEQRRQWHATPVLLPGKSHGQRSLVGCSPWGGWQSDRTEQLHFHFSLSCIGEGNGNPLQCSCLENPRDGGAWWAAVYGVEQSRTGLNRLSRSSSRKWTDWGLVTTGI